MAKIISYKKLKSQFKELERDVFSKNQLIVSLQASEAKSNPFCEKLPLPYQQLDQDGKILQVNQQWLNVLGYSRQEAVGASFNQILHPSEVERFQTTYNTWEAKGDFLDGEFCFQKKDGTSINFSIKGTVEKSGVDDSYQAHCLLSEIVKPKQLNSRTHNVQNAWGNTFDTIDDVITIQDKNLIIVRANKAAHKRLNADEGNLVGRYCYEIFTGKSQPCVNCPLLATLNDGNSHLSIITNDMLGMVFEVKSTLIPATSDGEEYLVHVARDITQQIETEKTLRESNERFVKVFESNPAPMVISEIKSGIFRNVNQRWVDMLGYTTKELIGKSSKDVCIWQDPAARELAVATLSTNTSFSNYPITFLTKKGESRSALWSAEMIISNGQEVMLSLFNDITEQKVTDEKLLESEEKFSLAFDSSPDSISINKLDDGLFVEINTGFTKLTGYTENDIRGKTSLDINIWHDPEERKRLTQSLKKQGYCENFEGKVRKKDGRITTALMSAREFTLNNIPHLISITRDISEIRRIESEIIYQKILFETMFNAIDDGVVITDVSRKIIFSNNGMKNNFGYDSSELKGKTTKLLYADPELYNNAGSVVFNENSTEKKQRYVSAYKDKSGNVFAGETFGVKLYDQNNNWIGNLGIMRDVSERQKAEAERDRLIAAIEQTNDSIVIADRDGNIQYVNPACESVTGYTKNELLGQNPRILKSDVHEDLFYQDLWKNLNSGKTFHGRVINKRKNGQLFTEETTISPIFDNEGQIVNFIAVKRDISDQIVLESQLQQAQKMEAVGRLTGGVAHDFNNILGVIIGYTELALKDNDSNKKTNSKLEKILDAANRSAEIVSQLLAFSRKQTISPKVLDLNTAVSGMLKMLGSLIGETIALTWLPAPDALLIKMDTGQINQIITNFCVNAKDAIDGIGKITIETTRVHFDQDYCTNHVGFRTGEFIQLSVSDNGCGFNKEIQDKIFDPFFTTKKLGLGTGLGLSTVYGIMKQNDGFINVYSEPGRGTTFKVYFPSYNQAELELKTKYSSEIKKSKGETVLLVEDDVALLELAKQMLERLGYFILAASKPTDALRIAEDFTGNIDIVLTDVVMPEMTGKEVAHLVQQLYPNIKVLFSSGYTADVIAQNGILDEGIQFIQKPYSIGDLGRKLRSILS